MSLDQGADERRIAHLLRVSGVGPASAPPPPSYPPDIPAPEGSSGDWVDEILARTRPASTPPPPEENVDQEQPEHEAKVELETEEVLAPAGWLQPHPGYYPAIPTTLPVLAAPAALSPKTRLLIYNASAAGAGWGLGLLGLFRRTIAACDADAGAGAALVLGTGACLLIAHVWDRRTRHWWIGLAWAARIPLTTAITALGLYAPGAQL
ncbi:hypothetical protein [Streptomyces sp. NPDC051569]|uniref:hypothetical protein n=1 Tax=Streptomyces sp. NPDC051569 TaxID=3365661 RepID=UPI0037A29F75